MDKPKSDKSELIVVSWNVQNLFNAEQDGNEYSEYLPTHGWTEEMYKTRLSRLATAVSYEPLKNADVFVFNEVENDAVAKDIINLDFFKKNGFIYFATAGEANGAIKTAVISKIPILEAKVHSVNGIRPVLEVELQNLGEPVFILAIHAKSNIEGIEETAPLRLKLAKLLNTVSTTVFKEHPDALIIVAGDFNETYESKNMMCDARNASNNCPLNLLPDFRFGYWYCPWLDMKNDFQADGSYNYNGKWFRYDNILVSYSGQDKKGWEYEDGGVLFKGILQTTDYKPNAFRRELLTGVSDHLPVWVRFGQ